MAAFGNTDRLIWAIQEGALEERPWVSFVPLLREALGARYANLIFRRVGSDPSEEVEISSGEAPAWVGPQYLKEFFRRDPIPYFRMQPGKVYEYKELAGSDDPAKDGFRRDFLLPAGFAHFLIFRVVEPGGANIWVTVTRDEHAAAFDAEERFLCERMAAHLSPALACRSALVRANAEKEEYKRASAMLSFGVIALDAQERIIRLDQTASGSLEQSDSLCIERGRLSSRSDNGRLQRAIRKALNAKLTQSLHISGDPGADLLIVPADKLTSADEPAPRLLVYISSGSRCSRDRSSHIAAAFDLSLTQAKLAALLVEGLSLADAAREIGITEQTARTYSKHIYLRTGTSRQGDLIQRILKSVITLA